MPDGEVNITLTYDEYERLLLVMGYAVGAAFSHGDQQMAYGFVDLINRVNKDKPHFQPYAIPDEFKSDRKKRKKSQ
jgi:hypothetical protein